jgi:hypothetical protein
MSTLWLKAGLVATGITLAAGMTAAAFAGTPSASHPVATSGSTHTTKLDGTCKNGKGPEAGSPQSKKMFGCYSGEPVLVSGTVTSVAKKPTGAGGGDYTEVLGLKSDNGRFTVFVTPKTNVTKDRKPVGGTPPAFSTGEHIVVKGISNKPGSSMVAIVIVK